MKALFAGQDPPFTFQGQIGGTPGHEHGHKKEFDKIDSVCSPLTIVADTTSTSGRSGAELLVTSGACLSQVGRAFHATAGHSPLTSSSMEAPAILATGIPTDSLPRAWPVDNACSRRRRQQLAAADF